MGVNVKVSICIVNWNTREHLRKCLESLKADEEVEDREIIVVDNNSADDSVRMVRESFPDVQIIENENNVGFARANNQMLAVACGDYALLLNSDTEVLPGSIGVLIDFLERTPEAGACGPKLLNEDFSYQRSFMDFPTLAYELKYHLKYHFLPFSRFFTNLLDYEYTRQCQSVIDETIRVNVVSAACMLVRMSMIQEVGPLAEDYFLYSEENDWCWRMKRKGWAVYYVPSASIIHLGGKSTGIAGENSKTYHFYLSRYKFFTKYRGRWTVLALRLVNIFFWFWLMCVKAVKRRVGCRGEGDRNADASGWGENEFFGKMLSIYMNK